MSGTIDPVAGVVGAMAAYAFASAPSPGPDMASDPPAVALELIKRLEQAEAASAGSAQARLGANVDIRM